MDNIKVHKSDIILKWVEQIGITDKLSFKEKIDKLKEIIEVIPNDFNGSRFGHDSIRLEGSKQFIIYILGIISIFYYMETPTVRLEINMNKLPLSKIIEPYNKDLEHWACYIRLIERTKKFVTI